VEKVTRIALGLRRQRRLEELSDSQQLPGSVRPVRQVQPLERTPPWENGASRLPEWAVALRTRRASSHGVLECAESRHASVGRRGGGGVACGCGFRPTLPTSLCTARSQTFPRRRRISANASDSQTSCPQEKTSASQTTEPDWPQKWQRLKSMKMSRAIPELSVRGLRLHIGADPSSRSVLLRAPDRRHPGCRSARMVG
jgi:hypothetical protein